MGEEMRRANGRGHDEEMRRANGRGDEMIKLAKRKSPEIPHTTKIYFSCWCMIRDNPYLV